MRQSLWYSMVAVLVSVVLMAAGGAFYTQWRIDRTNQRFCDFVVTLDDAFTQPPAPGVPDTEIRRRFAAAVHQLRIDLQCEVDGRKP